MLHYIGLDVSMKTTSICIIDQIGKIIVQDELETDPSTIAGFIKGTQLNIEKIVLESGSISRWLCIELEVRGIEVICIDAFKASRVLATNVVKTDKNDARMLAELARTNFYSKITLCSQDNAEMKILLNSRRTLKNISTQIKNTIRGHLKAFGIRLGQISSHKFLPKVFELIKDKSEIVNLAISSLLVSFKNINIEIDKIDLKVEVLAKNNEDVQLLCTIPGVGPITSLSFLTYLGDPKRFKNSKAVGAVFGMTPKKYESGDTSIMGRISKRGCSEVRTLLTEAANSMMTRTKSWCKPKAWGLKLRKKKGSKKANLALGRKLATIMHRMLITRKPFEYGEPKIQTELKPKKELVNL